MKLDRTWMAIPVALALAGGPAAAQTPPAKDADLAAEVKKLREEVEQLKAKADEAEVKAKDAVVLGDIPGAFRIPGTETSLHLYGFVELNWVHAFGTDNADSDYSTFAPYLPLFGTAEGKRKDRDYLTGRTTRFGFESATPTKYGVLAAKIEGDFNNEPRTGNAALYGSDRNVFTQQVTNSYGFRLRHGYLQYAGLLIGQSWSTFMDVDYLPETVDFNGTIGATFIRQPQIRFAYGTPDWGTFTVALENSSTYVIDPGTVSAIPTSLSRMPDLIVRWDRSYDWGALGLRAVTQELRIHDGASARATKRGWGAAATFALKLRDNNDLLSVQVTGGNGIGRYLNYVEGALYDGANNEIRVEAAGGVVAGYALKLNDWARVNFVYGQVRNFDNAYTRLAAVTGFNAGRFGVNRYVQQAHVGPIFTPAKGLDVGVEAIWADRRTLFGEKGEDKRLNFSAKYYIN